MVSMVLVRKEPRLTGFVPFENGAQVRLEFLLGGRPISDRLWFLNRQPPTTQDQIDALAEGAAVWYEEQLLPFLSSDLEFTGVVARSWDSDPPPLEGVASRSELGGVSVAACSANVAIRVWFKGSSAQTFPDNSNFVPGVPIDQVTGNEYSATIREAVFEAYVSLIDAAAVFGPFPAWRWVIASETVAGNLRSSLAVARMDFVQFHTNIVSQRRRRIQP